MISRRATFAGLTAAALSNVGRGRAQSPSEPVKIGIISDMTGTYQENGGPGNKAAVELAIEDFGGSLLGRPLQVIQADGQNKPDVTSVIARKWIDEQDVRLLMDGASSSAALAIQQVSREKKRVFCTTSSIATALVGASCSPYSFQFMANATSLARTVGGALTEQGHRTWFFITVDGDAGASLQRGAEEAIRPAGGTILGTVRAPVGTTDFSSYILQAQASGAKVIGLANAGSDLQNCIKQAGEFGITKAGQLMATLILEISDVLALGQDVCQGLVLANSFYWNYSPATRAWSDRYVAKMGKPPTSGQACAYSGAMHWMKAVSAVGSLDADAVAATMHRTPLNDFNNQDVRILASGSVPHTTFLWIVKPKAESSHRWDTFRLLATLPSPTAFPPSGAFGCQLT